jgi:hypothetical protein
MNAYIYNAALYCKTCAQILRKNLRAESKTDTGDSGDWPQGPYRDGESDSPQHCDRCSLFLRNPLTDEGLKYVTNRYMEAEGSKKHPVLMQWIEYYGIHPEADPRILLASIALGDLSFHAARYTSGELLKKAVRMAQSGDAGWSYQLKLAFDANGGAFPCLGGITLDKAVKVYNRL